MDPRTVQYYEDHADDVFAKYSSGGSGIENYFALAFPPGAEILDIGAGSGRDMDTLIREDYEAYGVEPSRRLRELASENPPGLSGSCIAQVPAKLRSPAGCTSVRSILDQTTAP